jgi:hypothetical protein
MQHRMRWSLWHKLLDYVTFQTYQDQVNRSSHMILIDFTISHICCLCSTYKKKDSQENHLQGLFQRVQKNWKNLHKIYMLLLLGFGNNRCNFLSASAKSLCGLSSNPTNGETKGQIIKNSKCNK